MAILLQGGGGEKFGIIKGPLFIEGFAKTLEQ